MIRLALDPSLATLQVCREEIGVCLDIHVDALLQLLDLLVVLYDVLAVDEGAKKAICWVLILHRGRLLQHQFLELLRMKTKLSQCLLSHGLVFELRLAGTLFNQLLKVLLMPKLLLYHILMLKFL